MAVKHNLMYRLSLAVIPPAYNFLSRLLFATCKVEFFGKEIFDSYEEGKKPYISLYWHYGILYYLHFARGKKMAAMISSSKDGEYIAAFLRNLGYLPIRGSSNRDGVAALKSMLKAMKNGWNSVIVADGSKGPELKLQPGAILLASRTGNPIIPTTWSADRYISFKSWDRTVLPMPFSRIAVWFGEPIYISRKEGADEREKTIARVEGELLDIYRKAWQHFDKKRH